jgi:hypothetical protein
VILNITYWTRLFIVRPPDCAAAVITKIISSLLEYPNSSIALQSPHPTGFDDFILLSTANKLIEDVSTYSYWAGIFSNAAEKHVDTSFHGFLKLGEGNSTRLATEQGYVYHDAKHDNYFGSAHLDGRVTYRYHLPSTSRVNETTRLAHHAAHPHNRTHGEGGMAHPHNRNPTHTGSTGMAHTHTHNGTRGVHAAHNQTHR